jgi:hypothetical protein
MPLKRMNSRITRASTREDDDNTQDVAVVAAVHGKMLPEPPGNPSTLTIAHEGPGQIVMRRSRPLAWSSRRTTSNR